MTLFKNLEMPFDANSICILVLTLPLLVSLISPLKRTNKFFFYAAAISVSILNVALLLYIGHSANPCRISQLFVFSFERFSWIFCILVNACWALALLYSSSYLRYRFEEKAETFHRYLAASVSLVLGAGLAANFFTLIFFYILSIPVIYPLITIRANRESQKAGAIYLLSTLLPSLLIICPVVLLFFPLAAPFSTYTIQSLGYGTGTASLLLGLMVVGFSKNCVAPFHMWLPISAVAPAPVSALVHSVGAVQTSTIALLKITTSVYGTKYLASLSNHFLLTGWITYLCGFTALYTAYRAWTAPDLKQRFSFSTVGQLSYIITAILLGTKQTTIGATLHIVTHSLAKMNLFFCAGIFASIFGTTNAAEVAL